MVASFASRRPLSLTDTVRYSVRYVRPGITSPIATVVVLLVVVVATVAIATVAVLIGHFAYPTMDDDSMFTLLFEVHLNLIRHHRALPFSVSCLQHVLFNDF
ncbi:hypothetical protein AB6A40_008005 [Gnathostoma spinigerum]|uniref:Uncharacterized protein n=1 Tax=Gnathostoma spinigerum TaxID=75299 RepID=A0ABD6EV09_9BILA